MRYLVVDDKRVSVREGFVLDSEDCRLKQEQFYIVRGFNSRETAERYCCTYNHYIDESGIVCAGCSKGCRMTAYDCAHGNVKCTNVF